MSLRSSVSKVSRMKTPIKRTSSIQSSVITGMGKTQSIQEPVKAKPMVNYAKMKVEQVVKAHMD